MTVCECCRYLEQTVFGLCGYCELNYKRDSCSRITDREKPQAEIEMAKPE